MQTKIAKVKYRLAKFAELLRTEDGRNGDSHICKQYLNGKISGLKEAVDILEGREVKEEKTHG